MTAREKIEEERSRRLRRARRSSLVVRFRIALSFLLVLGVGAKGIYETNTGWFEFLVGIAAVALLARRLKNGRFQVPSDSRVYRRLLTEQEAEVRAILADVAPVIVDGPSIWVNRRDEKDISPSVVEDSWRQYHLLLTLGFMKLLRSDPGAARALLAHEMAHIEQKDVQLWRLASAYGQVVVRFLLPINACVALVFVGAACQTLWGGDGDQLGVGGGLLGAANPEILHSHALNTINSSLMSVGVMLAFHESIRRKRRESETLADTAAVLRCGPEGLTRALLAVLPAVPGGGFLDMHPPTLGRLNHVKQLESKLREDGRLLGHEVAQSDSNLTPLVIEPILLHIRNFRDLVGVGEPKSKERVRAFRVAIATSLLVPGLFCSGDDLRTLAGYGTAEYLSIYAYSIASSFILAGAAPVLFRKLRVVNAIVALGAVDALFRGTAIVATLLFGNYGQVFRPLVYFCGPLAMFSPFLFLLRPGVSLKRILLAAGVAGVALGLFCGPLGDVLFVSLASDSFRVEWRWPSYVKSFTLYAVELRLLAPDLSNSVERFLVSRSNPVASLVSIMWPLVFVFVLFRQMPAHVRRMILEPTPAAGNDADDAMGVPLSPSSPAEASQLSGSSSPSA